MYCRRCEGVVYHDSMYKNETFVDLACMSCGKRWFVNKATVLGRYVLNATKD